MSEVIETDVVFKSWLALRKADMDSAFVIILEEERKARLEKLRLVRQ